MIEKSRRCPYLPGLRLLGFFLAMLVIAGCSSVPPSDRLQGDAPGEVLPYRAARNPDAIKQGTKDLACLLTAIVCVPVQLFFTIYHVSDQTIKNYKSRNP